MNLPATFAGLRELCVRWTIQSVTVLAAMFIATVGAWGQATTFVRDSITDSRAALSLEHAALVADSPAGASCNR